MFKDKLISDIFEAIDNKDTTKFCSFLTEECELTFGNMPTVSGKKNIYDVIDNFFNSIKGLSHNLSDEIGKDDNLITYGTVTYTRLDDKQVTANFCNIFKMNGDLIDKYHIFVDISLLYS